MWKKWQIPQFLLPETEAFKWRRSESFGTEIQKRLEEVESSQLASYECLVTGLLARELDIPAVLCRLKEPWTETGSPH